MVRDLAFVDKRLFRLAYAIQFPVAVMAFFTLWSQVAGQGHLDIMPWYWKLALGAAVSLACVKATAAAVEGEQAWNPRALKWLAITLVLMLACGVVTYYVHLYEPQDEDQPEEDLSNTQSCGFAGPLKAWLRPAPPAAPARLLPYAA